MVSSGSWSKVIFITCKDCRPGFVNGEANIVIDSFTMGLLLQLEFESQMLSHIMLDSLGSGLFNKYRVGTWICATKI